MKLKSVSGLTFYADDLKITSKFYQSLGFLRSASDENHISFRLNWFTLDFISSKLEEKQEFKKDADSKNKGEGFYINISVDNADGIYEEVIKLGLKPSSEPRDWPWGAREFALKDPNGYKLIFVQKA